MAGFGRYCSTAIVAASLGAGLALAKPEHGLAALAEDALYQSQAIVTGQVEPERSRGVALCLADVLVKLSGDPTVVRDPRLPPLLAAATSFMASFRYHDRMEGIPIHDEQGTRDRPYDLTVSFDPPKIDVALATLGRSKWTAPRPVLALFIAFEIGGAQHLLARDRDGDFAQRLSLGEASARRGLEIALPTASQADALPSGGAPADLAAAAAEMGGDLPLVGRLVWSDGSLSWQAEWRLAWQGREHRWTVPAETFDAAFRSGLEGAEQILSGHGEP